MWLGRDRVPGIVTVAQLALGGQHVQDHRRDQRIGGRDIDVARTSAGQGGGGAFKDRKPDRMLAKNQLNRGHAVKVQPRRGGGEILAQVGMKAQHQRQGQDQLRPRRLHALLQLRLATGRPGALCQKRDPRGEIDVIAQPRGPAHDLALPVAPDPAGMALIMRATLDQCICLFPAVAIGHRRNAPGKDRGQLCHATCPSANASAIQTACIGIPRSMTNLNGAFSGVRAVLQFCHMPNDHDLVRTAPADDA
jgi:hypothetical protein